MKDKNLKAQNTEKNGENVFPFITKILSKYAILILTAIVVLTYFQTVGFDLVFCDDHEIIIKRYDRIAELNRWDDELFMGYINTNYYRPVVNLSFLIDAQISGQEAYFYHITNIILHALFVVLLFILLKKFDFKSITAFFAAAFFAVHPLFTNAVAWIAGRNDLLFGVFSLLSFLFLINHYKTKKNLYLAIHLLALLLAFLSKETAFIFPAVLVSYLVLFQKEKLLSRSNITYIFYWIVIIVFAFIMRSASTLGEDINRMGIDVFLMNLRTIPEYLAKFFLPVNLSVLPAFSLFSTITGVLFLIGLAIMIYYRNKFRNSYILLGLIWFFSLTLPTMFFTILNSNDWNEYLECRAYLPSVGIILIILGLLPEKLRGFRTKWMFLIATFLIVLFGIITFFESKIYEDSITFYESAVEDNDDKALYHEMLASIYLSIGKLDQAEEQIRKTIEANPDYSKYYSKIAAFYLDFKYDTDSALKYYKLALDKDPDKILYYNKIATIYHTRKEDDKAINLIKNALNKFPDEKNLYMDLISMLLDKQQIDSAIVYTDKAVKHGADRSGLINLYSEWAKYLIDNKNVEDGSKLILKAYSIDSTSQTALNMTYYYYNYIQKDEAKAAEIRNKLFNTTTKKLN
jgi:tetratricopeptide (TPR) repeat protein